MPSKDDPITTEHQVRGYLRASELEVWRRTTPRRQASARVRRGVRAILVAEGHIEPEEGEHQFAAGAAVEERANVVQWLRLLEQLGETPSPGELADAIADGRHLR